jgi:hypothetical protein
VKKEKKPADPRQDATAERKARAREAGQVIERSPLRRLLDPFDTMRANRVLAPHDPRLNDIRWLTGEALRRCHHRARLDELRATPPDRVGGAGFGPRAGLPHSEAALQARDKLRRVEEKVGPRAWPILSRIVIAGAGVRECRSFVPELNTPWRHQRVGWPRQRHEPFALLSTTIQHQSAIADLRQLVVRTYCFDATISVEKAPWHYITISRWNLART